MPKHEKNDVELIRTWTLSTAATLGSAVRAKGILQELQSRVPAASKKSLAVDGTDIILAMPASEKAVFNAAAAIVAKAMEALRPCPSSLVRSRTSSPSRSANGTAGLRTAVCRAQEPGPCG
jgi:hypothetical protein